MAIETWLAHDEFQTPAKLARYPVYFLAQAVKPARLIADRLAHSGWRAILSETLSQRQTPFAGGHSRFRALDRSGHDVAALLGSGTQAIERRPDRARIPARAPGGKAFDLLGLGVRGHRECAGGSAGQR